MNSFPTFKHGEIGGGGEIFKILEVFLDPWTALFLNKVLILYSHLPRNLVLTLMNYIYAKVKSISSPIRVRKGAVFRYRPRVQKQVLLVAYRKT